MKIIDEYRKLIEDVAVVKSKLTTAQRELHKNMMIYKPADAKGIDYSREVVQTSVYQQPVLITANNIYKLNNSIMELRRELEQLEEQKKILEKTLTELGDINKQIIIYRMQNYPLWKISQKTHVSVSTVKRYIAKINNEIFKDEPI